MADAIIKVAVADTATYSDVSDEEQIEHLQKLVELKENRAAILRMTSQDWTLKLEETKELLQYYEQLKSKYAETVKTFTTVEEEANKLLLRIQFKSKM